MTLSRRVVRAARHVAAVLPVTDPAWVAAFAAVGAAGVCIGEPDFPTALAAYRAAVAATRSAVPPPDAPGWFEPDRAGWDRQERWRALHPLPAVDDGREWLAELTLRSLEGVPPVCAAEFTELAVWFRANEERLRAAADVEGLVALGDGSGAAVAEITAALARGPRAVGAGAVADVVRRLRAERG